MSNPLKELCFAFKGLLAFLSFLLGINCIDGETWGTYLLELT